MAPILENKFGGKAKKRGCFGEMGGEGAGIIDIHEPIRSGGIIDRKVSLFPARRGKGQKKGILFIAQYPQNVYPRVNDTVANVNECPDY